MRRAEHLKVLELNNDANEDAIKKSFRRLSMKHHPDRPGGCNEKFQKINNAFSYLTNKNNEQDEENPFNFAGARHGEPINPQDIFNMMFNMNDLFDGSGFNRTDMPNIRVFHNGVPININKKKPPPIVEHLDITITQSYTGCKIPITIKRWYTKPGMNEENEKIYVDIPCGIDNNEMIIMRDKGHVESENNRGDVKIFIKVINDSCFSREGLNIVLNKNISLKDALCGFCFTVDHISGKSYTLRNNKIIKPNSKTSLAGMGFKRDDKFGSLDIIFNIEFPDKLDSETINSLQKLL